MSSRTVVIEITTGEQWAIASLLDPDAWYDTPLAESFGATADEAMHDLIGKVTFNDDSQNI